jgi:type I restriction enzyme S subunit
MSAYVYETPGNLMLPDLIFRLNTDDSCNRIYLWQLINHDLFRKTVSALANGTASSMPNISKQKLSKLIIPLPPINFQEQFADFVQQADKSKFVCLTQTANHIERKFTRNSLSIMHF